MKSKVLELLEGAGDTFLSGERMSQTLGVSRAAIWKQVERLRAAGYEIEAVTNQGYRLKSRPETLDAGQILARLEGHPWRDRVTVVEQVDSTNDLAKREAVLGAPEGSVYVADEQTGGRGRQGRRFISPRGKGLYLSVLLRPACAPQDISHATAMAAVATCDAIERACGVRPGIKWTNDLILGEKKCTGILSELSAEWESGRLEYVVIGIGVNCAQTPEDFPPELREKATSVGWETGRAVDRNALAAELIERLSDLSAGLLSEKRQWMARYAADCITLGRQVRILRGGSVRTGTALNVEENGALLVRYDSGETGLVFSGEVSIRGTHGYL